MQGMELPGLSNTSAYVSPIMQSSLVSPGSRELPPRSARNPFGMILSTRLHAAAQPYTGMTMTYDTAGD